MICLIYHSIICSSIIMYPHTDGTENCMIASLHIALHLQNKSSLERISIYMALQNIMW